MSGRGQPRDYMLALERVQSMIRQQTQKTRQRNSRGRDIRLGLKRITRVIPSVQRWKGVHVAGTNGKGSICSFLSGLFRMNGISHGMFLSPAIPEPRYGLTVNGRSVDADLYQQERNALLRTAASLAFKAKMPGPEGDLAPLSPFETDTATAFRIFNKVRVEYGIVEVGMGGKTDATNAMSDKSITIISKIDLDHQEYLGDTIEKIAKVKAGIMKTGVLCIVDGSNSEAVWKTLMKQAEVVGAPILSTTRARRLIKKLDTTRFPLLEYQKQNLLCALAAFRHLFPRLPIDVNKLLERKPLLPGRMELVRVGEFMNGARSEPILVDGAHNRMAMRALSEHVDGDVRQDNQPITWIVGFSSSESKPFAELVNEAVRPQDNLAFVEFEQEDNDPPPVPALLGREFAESILEAPEQLYQGSPSVAEGLRWACEKAGEGPVVVTGSLYLVRDLLRLDGIKSRNLGLAFPGKKKLWRFIRLSQERELTPDEEKEFKRARRFHYLDPGHSTLLRRHGIERKITSPDVPEEVREGQRQASRFAHEAELYTKLLEKLESEQLLQIEGPPLVDSEQPELLDAETLQQRIWAANRGWTEVMEPIRGHPTLPGKKYMSYVELFGRKRRPSKAHEWNPFTSYRPLRRRTAAKPEQPQKPEQRRKPGQRRRSWRDRRPGRDRRLGRDRRSWRDRRSGWDWRSGRDRRSGRPRMPRKPIRYQ